MRQSTKQPGLVINNGRQSSKRTPTGQQTLILILILTLTVIRIVMSPSGPIYFAYLTWRQDNNTTNDNNNTHADIYSVIAFGAKPHAKVHFGPPSESRSAPGGRQLVGQAANLTFESACRLL